MTAPERIYLQGAADAPDCKDPSSGVTWCWRQIENDDIEYVRADLAHDTTAVHSRYNRDTPETDLFGEVPKAPAPEFISIEGLRAALLEPREIVRDAEGWLTHPALPICDEGTRFDKLLEAFGIEPVFVSMEFDDEAFYDRWCEEGLSDCSIWTPAPPAGDGWRLLEIYMTEDGVCALFGRDWYVAEKERKKSLRAERRAERMALRDQNKEQP